MAAKYWYVAGNGSANWSVAGNWYSGSGGTGIVLGVPTATDDAIVNAASGSGTLTIAATSTCSSLNTSTFTGTLAGASALNIVSLALTGATVLSLGGTHSYTGTITISGAAVNGVILANGKTHSGAVTINTTTGSFVFNDFFTCTGTFTLTAGNISGTSISAGIFGSANTNTRVFNFTNLYLSGSGITLSIGLANQTGLTWTATNIYLTNTTATTKSITLNNAVSCTNLYLQGSGASATTISAASTAIIAPNLYVSKLAGTLLFGVCVFSSITFVTGSTINLSSVNAVTVYGSVTMCAAMTVTTTGTLTFSSYSGNPNTNYVFTTFGKTFTGILNVNDQNLYNTTLTVVGDYISTYSVATGTTISSAASVTFQNGINVGGAIVVNSTNGSTLIPVSFNSVTAPAMTFTLGDVTLGDTTLSGVLNHSSGNLTFTSNSTSTIFSFTSSNSNVRTINLNNATINLTGNTGNIWNTNVTTNLTLNSGTSTIVITDSFSNTVGFVCGAANTYYTLKINRSSASAINPITNISGTSTFYNFIDLTQTPGGNHQIVFSSGQTVNIYDTFQVGNSVNQTLLYQTSGGNFLLNKLNLGIVVVQNCYIQASNALQANNWYAIGGSVDGGGNTNWIFNNLRRSLSSLGVG